MSSGEDIYGAGGKAPPSGTALPRVLSESRLSNTFLGDLIEICIVTSDHRRVMEGLVALGIGPWRVYTFDASTVTERTYRGEAADFALKVCFAEAANVTWEIMQPLRGPSIFQEFLDEHGEGIHHVAFDCADAPWDERIASFTQRGFPPSQSGRFADQNPFVFFATEGATATTFETYRFDESFRFPEPETWFPGPPPPDGSPPPDD